MNNIIFDRCPTCKGEGVTYDESQHNGNIDLDSEEKCYHCLGKKKIERYMTDEERIERLEKIIEDLWGKKIKPLG